MNTRFHPPLRVIGFCLIFVGGLSTLARGQEPRVLFNGRDLAGWKVFVDQKGENYDPASSADPAKIFKVEDGVLHISGERYGYIITEDEYENYHLTVEFKWGEKRWAPRATAARDSGILYHCQGPDKIWPTSIECQIIEDFCGDFILVGGTSLTVGGKTQKGGRFIRTKSFEKPLGEWNTLEVVCAGDKILHKVNGEVVNEGSGASVTKGKILLQSEGAEVFFRKVELKPLPR
jgi:hypothetical protein